MTNLVEKEIADVILRAFDELRGSTESAFIMEYVLAIIFLRQISGVSSSESEARKSLSATTPRPFELKSHYQIIVPEGADFWSLHRSCRGYKDDRETDIPKRLDDALSSIARANPKFQAVFQGIKFDTPRLGSRSQRANLVCRILNLFAVTALDLPMVVDQHNFGFVYDEVIEKFAEGLGKKFGSFYTPRSLSSLLVRLLDPQPEMTICDPACGSGSMLLQSAQYIRKNYSSSKYSLSGQEQNGTFWTLAQLNMLVHGETHFLIELDDTLQHPRLVDESDRLVQYDIGISQIPFGATTWDSEAAAQDRYRRFSRGIPPQKKPDYAFILHLLTTMNPETGIVGVIVPLGTLFRGGVERAIRESIIRDRILDAVIELPEGLLHGTAVPAAIMIFKAGRSNCSVIFINASKSFQVGKLKNRLQEEDISRIVEVYKAREEVKGICHISSIDEILENDCNLNVRRYVPDEIATQFRDPDQIRSDWLLLEGRLKTLDAKMHGYLDMLRK